MSTFDVIGQGGSEDPHEADGAFAEQMQRDDRVSDRHMTLNTKTAPGAAAPGA